MKIFVIVCLGSLCFNSSYCFAQSNKDLSNKKLYDSIASELFLIDENDQKYRNQMEFVSNKFGAESKQMATLIENMKKADSVDLQKVDLIVSKYGWLSPNLIGSQGSSTLFMVIQHADLTTQTKYLPILKNAAEAGSLKYSSLALLIDRVALRQGKKQIYGTQISWNYKTGEYYVLPLEDAENVDERRKKVGLPMLTDYTNACCNFSWTIENYYKAIKSHEK